MHRRIGLSIVLCLAPCLASAQVVLGLFPPGTVTPTATPLLVIPLVTACGQPLQPAVQSFVLGTGPLYVQWTDPRDPAGRTACQTLDLTTQLAGVVTCTRTPCPVFPFFLQSSGGPWTLGTPLLSAPPPVVQACTPLGITVLRYTGSTARGDPVTVDFQVTGTSLPITDLQLFLNTTPTHDDPPAWDQTGTNLSHVSGLTVLAPASGTFYLQLRVQDSSGCTGHTGTVRKVTVK